MKLLITLTYISLFFYSVSAYALPKAAVIAVPTQHDSINASAYTATSGMESIIEKSGRFTLIQENALLSDKTKESFSTEDLLSNAKKNDADIIFLVSVYQKGTVSFGELKVISLSGTTESLNRGIRVKSRLMQNIPLLLQQECADIISTVPIIFTATHQNNRQYLINAGTYSGIESGKRYTLADGNSITVTDTGRYHSLVRGSCSEDSNTIKQYPGVSHIQQSLDDQLSENINRKYGAGYAYLKNTPPDRQYLESLFIVNPLGNVLLPGYGASLSTHYMDFDNPVPAYGSMGACAALYLFELLYVPAKNKFSVNFFPWVQDSDKSDHDLRTQQYLWAMIPLTFSATYLDQLLLQYHHDSVLPPGAGNLYATALHSLIVPGGGFFYKGHRGLGWSYFAAEFGTGMYAAMHWDTREGRYALYGLGALKIADIVHAMLIQPGYDFYTEEKYETTDLKVSVETQPDIYGKPALYAGFGTTF